MKARNDSKGYMRGALGIDDNKGVDFVDRSRDVAAEKAIYGQSWWNLDGTHDVDGTKEKRRFKESPDYDTK